MLGEIEFENVTKQYDGVDALNHVSFTVEGGSFFSILGPSGCGKTTLLRLLAGFDQPDDGRVLLDGKDISKLPPNQRPVNTVFQNYALFPHLSVFENIAFGLKVAKKPRNEILREVEKMLHLIQMEEHAYKKPHEISGGQKQRVAIARALINKPRVLLLDEPLAALDLKLRQKMLFEIDLIHDEVGITFLFVTHDQTEAMAVSDKIAVIHRGAIEQIGSPVELYESPKSSFVAAFIGDTNFFDGVVSQAVSSDYSRVNIAGFHDILCFNDKPLRIGGPVHLSIRPEKVNISRDEPPPHEKHNIFQGYVEDIIYKGDHTCYWVRSGEERVSIAQQHHRSFLTEKPIEWDEEVWFWWHAHDSYVLESWEPGDELLTQLPPEAIGDEDSEEEG